VAVHEQIISHSVTVIHSNLVNYGYIIRLTLLSGTKVFISFPKDPSPVFVTFTDGMINAQMPESRFSEAYHLLQSEHTVFLSALNLSGLQTVNLTTDPQLTNMLDLYPPERRPEIAGMFSASGERQSKTGP